MHFSYNSRREELFSIAKSLGADEITIKVDHNDTRIAAEHGLLFSILRMNRSLKMYHLKNPTSFKLDPEFWVMWAEIEAILNISQILTKLAQKEKAFTAAYGPLIKMHVYNLLSDDKVFVIDLEQENISCRPVRVLKLVSDFSDTGKTALNRAIIEFQRRFLGSKKEIVDEDCGPVVINERQLAATLLDLRTARGAHLTQAQRREAQAALKTRYIAFSVQYYKTERENRKKPLRAAEDDKDSDEEAEDSIDDDEVVAKKAKTNEMAAGGLVSGMGYAAVGEAEGFDLSLDSSDSDSESEKSEEDLALEDAAAAEKEFKKVFANWFGLVIDWKAEFAEKKLKGADLLDDLIDLDIGRLYEKIITEVDPDRQKYGFLPLMAGCCDGQIGALNAESFAERVISGANLVMTNGNTLLGDQMLEMLVVLRMNREFMEFMRREYAEEMKMTAPFNMTVTDEGE